MVMSIKINSKSLVLHGTFILVLSSLLTFGIVYAQEGMTAMFPLGPMPKLIVFIIATVVSIITDSLVCLSLVGGPRLLKVTIESALCAFVNIYWWDYIAPATGMTLLTLRFVQVGNPSWNYYIGSNVIFAFILNFFAEQVIFRRFEIRLNLFLRLARESKPSTAPSPNWQDALLAGIDTVLPTILFIVLSMLGLF